MSIMDINQRLDALRSVMKILDIEATIIPSSDPHQSEYVAAHWQERVWISGFTGSAGTVVVTHDHAGVWTDSRYWLQADEELSKSEFVLHKNLNQFATPYVDFLVQNLAPGSKVAVNGSMFSVASINSMSKQFLEAGLSFVYDDIDLISSVWNDRPQLSDSPVFIHHTEYSGKSAADKIASIRSSMHDQNVDAHLLTALDDIAWTCNLRGSDVDYNPVFIAYMLITNKEAILFINESKTSTINDYLANQGISTQSYVDVKSVLSSLPDGTKILIDKSLSNQEIFSAVKTHVVDGQSIAKKLKGIKNETEIEHVRKVMAKDGVALAKVFYWLEEQHKHGHTPSEYAFAQQLASFRRQNEGYVSESFGAIIGYNANGAIIHYHPQQETSASIKANGILLVDSGGQYIDGTTDTTRTVALSTPSEEQRKHYTLILKGMICLSRAVFPIGTVGAQLDTLARQYLWQYGCNFLHGTGHGVGFFLNVHEPPQGFAPIQSERGRTAFEPGMLTSNEPGFYIDGQYGMRIENLIVCQESSYKGFLDFETVTLYPFDLPLIEKSLLTDEEKEWINAYHADVFAKVSPMLSEELIEWFKGKCGEISL